MNLKEVIEYDLSEIVYSANTKEEKNELTTKSKIQLT